MTIGSKIKAARKAIGWSQTQLAKASGLSQTTISDLERGRNQGSTELAHIAKALRIDPLSMRAAPEGQNKADHVSANEIVNFQIPRMAVEGSMGQGSDYPEADEVIGQMTLTGDWLKKIVPTASIKKLAIISGKGHSMSPTFDDGDLLLVDTGVIAVDTDGIYVLSANSRLYIKTVRQRMDGVYEVSSDNPAVKTVDELNGKFEVAIHGRVVWAWNGRKL